MEEIVSESSFVLAGEWFSNISESYVPSPIPT